MTRAFKYNFSDLAILITFVLAVLIGLVFKWGYTAYPIDFMGGDAKDYYSALPSVFITHDFLHQTGNDWFLVKTSSGVVNVHPIGVAVLILPFFLLACGAALIFHFPVDGFSLPFQAGVAVAGLCYALIGLVYLKKLLRLHGIGEITTALIIVLTFFGTNLLNYTLSEAGMSHVYSFSLISAFLYYSSKFVKQQHNRDLLLAAVTLGLIVLVRPNNMLIVFSVLLWFNSAKQCSQFFGALLRNKKFYVAAILALAIVMLQNLVWLMQSGHLFHDTYKADGFHWLRPQILKMLFGFDNGFFIYTPLCLLFVLGLGVVYRESRFSFFAAVALLLVLFYFFACYWAYTYFDGLGIRVLVDYYGLFAFLGARLFMFFSAKKLAYASLAVVAALLGALSLVYCYQSNRQILLRSGMTAAQWNYIFLKTGEKYQGCLGGSHDLAPYANHDPELSLSKKADLQIPFDFSARDFGFTVSFDSINFNSNRIHLQINCARKELFENSSRGALVCVLLKDKVTRQDKSYFNFKLNETPATGCCDEKHYAYTSNMNGDFKAGDQLAVFLWNKDKQPFLVNEFSVNIYNYNYNIN